MKAGRNDPCPCGSGKKYKRCCLGKEVIPAETLHYKRLSEAYDRIVDRLMAYAEKQLGKQLADMALSEFFLWPEPENEVSEEQLYRAKQLFGPWFLFNWEYEADDTDVALSMPEETTIAEIFIEARGDKLNSLELRLIERINREPFSFWEVDSVDKGKGMELHDLLRGFRIKVQERTGSQFVQSGDVLFGCAVVIDGVGMLVSLSPTIIPPERKTEIIQFRKMLRQGHRKITNDTLYEWDTEIRGLYFHLDRTLHAKPQLSNTDGDPLEFHRLIYEVASADEAFEKLQDLCVTTASDDLVADAKRDVSGRIVSVEIPWDRQGHKASPELPNTILGHMVIDGHRLMAEVNSAERAAILRREIETRMGSGAQFKVDEIQDPETMMESRARGASKTRSAKEHEALMQRPEVQEQLTQLISRHWESWVDQKLPALGDKSPRQAVKTKDGRESVEALLQGAERDHGMDPFTALANRKGTHRAREILGLDPGKDKDAP